MQIHGSTKVCSKIKKVISDTVELNPTLKPSKIIKWKEVKAVPEAIDKGSTYLGKMSMWSRNADYNQWLVKSGI